MIQYQPRVRINLRRLEKRGRNIFQLEDEGRKRPELWWHRKWWNNNSRAGVRILRRKPNFVKVSQGLLILRVQN